MADAPRVFLSYSHDSDEHADRVLALADALRDLGIDVILDQYVHPAPEEGWPLWMDRNFDEAEFVLMVCTETYRRRVMGLEEPDKGPWVRWEGSLIYNRIYLDKPSGTRFIPVLLPGSAAGAHPRPRSGACLLQDRDVRPDRPGLRGPVPSPDRSAGHAPAEPRRADHPAPETTTATLLGPSAPGGRAAGVPQLQPRLGRARRPRPRPGRRPLRPAGST